MEDCSQVPSAEVPPPAVQLPRPSILTRWYIEFRIWFGKKFFTQPSSKSEADSPEGSSIVFGSGIVNLGFGQYLKRVSSVNEAMVMRHLQTHTIIPVPKIYGAWNWSNGRKERCYLLMERVPGEDLRTAWPKLKKSQRMKIAHQIATVIRKLRNVPQPPEFRGVICSFVGGRMDDPGLNPVWYQGNDWFDSVEDFVDELLRPIAREEHRDLAVERDVLLREQNRRLVLTHGDLTFRNIMVDPDTASLTGIVDWTTAAFMPIYWEAYKAEWGERKLSRQKREFIAAAHGTFPDELAILFRTDYAIAGKCQSGI